jgi:hypothetical protein
VLRISGAKRAEGIGGWRKSHNEKFYNLYSSSNTIQMMISRMKWAGQVALMEAKMNAYMFLAGRLEENRPLEGLTCRWQDTIKMDLKRYNRLAWTELIWLRIGASRGFF